MHDFKVGDRVHCYHHDLIDAVRGRNATITEVTPHNVYAHVDDAHNPSNRGYSFNTNHLKRLYEAPSDEELADVMASIKRAFERKDTDD